MAKVSVELDLSVVEKAIKAEVKPAVRDILAKHYDIPAMIAEELLREPTPKEQQEAASRLFPMPVFFGSALAARGRARVEKAIRDAIHAAADEYVKVVMDERRDAIYAAFRKMMKDSPDRLVTAFVEMIEGADLSLELATTLAIAEPERSYGD